MPVSNEVPARPSLQHSERLRATRLGLRAWGHRCRGPASTPFCDSAEYGRESPTGPGLEIRARWGTRGQGPRDGPVLAGGGDVTLLFFPPWGRVRPPEWPG